MIPISYYQILLQIIRRSFKRNSKNYELRAKSHRGFSKIFGKRAKRQKKTKQKCLKNVNLRVNVNETKIEVASHVVSLKFDTFFSFLFDA